MSQFTPGGTSPSGSEHHHHAREQGVTGHVKEVASDIGHKVREKTAQATSRLQERAGVAAERQKSIAAEKLDRLAEAIRHAAHELDEHNETGIARLIEQAAMQVDSLSDLVHEHDLGDLLESVENAARRHPALFLGGMFLAGTFVARVLKSSRGRNGRRGMSRYAGEDTSRYYDEDKEEEYQGERGYVSRGISEAAMGGPERRFSDYPGPGMQGESPERGSREDSPPGADPGSSPSAREWEQP